MFFDRLGQQYAKVRNSKDEIYHNLRCGLANSYLNEDGSIIDVKSGQSCGIEYDAQTKRYTFHVRTYFEDLKKGVGAYLGGLENGTEELSLLEQALRNIPEPL